MYPPAPAEQTQAPVVAQQPGAKATMNPAAPAPATAPQETDDALRLRGGCPGKLCGIPILPCRVNICIIPIPCC